MQELIDFLARKEVFIILLILAGALFLYFILWFSSFLKKQDVKKKLKNNTIELEKLSDEVILPPKEELVKKNLPALEKVEPPEEEVSKETVVEKPQEKPLQVAIEKTFVTPVSVEVEQTKIVEDEKSNTKPVQGSLGELYDKPIEILDIEPVEEVQYKEEVYTKEEAKQELQRIKEELEQEQIKKEEEEKNNALNAFEKDQEENAIISLEELFEKGRQITQEEIVKHEDEGNEPISIQELEARYKKSVVPKPLEPVEPRKEVVLEDFNQAGTKPYQNTNAYHPTPVISPIFGIEEEHIAKEDALELENTANFEKLDAEIRKTNEFLSKLRELQKKLD